MSMTLEQAIKQYEQIVSVCEHHNLTESQEEFEQLAAWLKILKKAKFEYDEAHRIVTCPTPDVTSYDKNRAQVILETFRGSLGKIEYES